MRQQIAYKIPHCKTNTKQNTVTYVLPKLCNTVIMKNHIDNCMSMDIFKKGNETLHLENIINKKHSGIIQYNSMYE